MKNKIFKYVYLTIIFCIFNLSYFSSKNYASENDGCKLVNENASKNIGEYLLGPGDLISVNVFSSSEISGDYEILNDGNVSLPIVGPVKLKDLTIVEAVRKLEKIFEDELYASALDIILKYSRPLSISVIGEINRPGVYKLEKDKTFRGGSSREFSSFASLPRLVDAIDAAGGITPKANIKNICLVRKSGNIDQKLIYYKFNLLDLLKNGNQENNPYLFDEDIVKVSRIEENFIFEKEILQSSIAPEKININIIGEVNNPGAKTIANNSNLLDAISAGGGTTYLTSKGNAEILRVKTNGEVSRLKYKFNLNDSNLSKLPKLYYGDTIVIYRNQINKTASFIMKISQPLYNIFRILEINKDLK